MRLQDIPTLKASEAKPLSREEMITLHDLLKRWVLLTYPFCGGSSEESDAIQTYLEIAVDVKRGVSPSIDEEKQELMRIHSEQQLPEFPSWLKE